MKWLATFILCLLPVSIAAQTPPPGSSPSVAILPLVTLCSPLEPDLGLYQKYGEIAFVEGAATFYIPGNKTVNGKLTIYMKPGFDENTFTIMFKIGALYCMVASGKNVVPAEPKELNGVGDNL